jgi:phosphoglycerate dehydrogenase-like enzyme
LDEVFAFSDVITLHCPPSADGGVVVDARVLSTMKKGAVLVNTAREGLVDWPAMNDALDSGRVAWYAVDAFDKEPPDNYDILRHPRVIPSPHIGGFTEESIDRATEVAVDNLLAVIGSGAA